MQRSDDPARRELLLRLAALPLFSGLDAHTLSDLADTMEWLALPGGAELFGQDEPSDALYVLVHGRLSAQRRDEEGCMRALGAVMPGECVGETGLIAGEPRSASVIATRDSDLLRLSRPAFERLIAAHPQSMLSLARVALRRFSGARGPLANPHCFALMAAHPGLDLIDFALRLARALGSDAERALVRAEEARGREPGWFGAREARSPHLIYIGNDDPTWAERCLRQSDCVLVLADATQAPISKTRLALPAAAEHLPIHLLLKQVDEPVPGRARAWRAVLPASTVHHHVRGEADLARLARRLTGRATGLVLSGGGARGFAHIGVVRALRDAGVEIDYVGGCSIGGIVGAGIAADWSYAQMVEAYRECFVATNPLSDWTLPLVSLRAGRKVSRLLRQAFGERDIEDLPIPFFCVSSNLTDGVLDVHERGPLWRWLRASCAIPGVLPPVFSGGRVLVDGGVIDNLPVGEMRRRLAGEIVAVDVGGNYRLETTLEETELPAWWKLLPEVFGLRKRPSLGQILLRAGMVNSDATVQRRRRQTKLLLKPVLEGIDLLEWQAFERTIDLGYQYALRRVGGPRDALTSETPVIGL
ncbi:MAG: patatin-like phospholipase family protein [Chiayiivirga sp.]|uniref:patatin-like phospholipase family protein n=1 Tax=Chiayiivirga sp. TaxID=2041042 RepID=UPI0025C65080|nr:patatin-like phospholipase family protein [Chiayiivirga sp.]MCI1711053.1 patatin-like phospholipase family protein [Chiayiivirga sp.]MCI1728129.1 patatin-like phospholipase family protein [Chiayiivirga sp.]